MSQVEQDVDFSQQAYWYTSKVKVAYSLNNNCHKKKQGVFVKQPSPCWGNLGLQGLGHGGQC